MKKNSFKKFLKEHYKVLLALFFVFIGSYTFKLFTYNYAMDTEKFIVYPSQILFDWLGLNRYSLVALKEIFSFIPFNIILTNWLTVILFYLSCVLMSYNFHRVKELNSKKLFFFLSILATSPIFLEQFNFTLQSAEIAFFLIVFQFGIYCFEKYIETQKYYYIPLTIILVTICFGAYQSFVPMFITETIILFYLYYEDKKEQKEKIFFTLKAIMIFILAFVLYLVIAKIIMNHLNIHGSSYLFGQIAWFHQPFLTNVKNVLKIMVKFYFGWCFGRVHYTPINTLVFIVAVLAILKKGKEKKYLDAVNIFVILMCPYIMTIALGNQEPVRAQLVLPLVCGFVIAYLYKDSKCRNGLVMGLIIIQMICSLVLQQQDYMRYQYDVVMAEEILNEVKEELPNRKIVFVGVYNSEGPRKLIKGEAMGISFFNSYGMGDRIGTFMKSLGYSLEEDYGFLPEATTLVQDLPAYPEKDCILITDTHIIVKLS